MIASDGAQLQKCCTEYLLPHKKCLLRSGNFDNIISVIANIISVE